MSKARSSCLYSGNIPFLEVLYQAYLDDPASVEPGWRAFFEQISAREGEAQRSPEFLERVQFKAPESRAQKQVALLQLINAYRFRGHRQADLDPLRQYERPPIADLEPAFHGLTEEDMDTRFNTGSLFGPEAATLREILEIVQTTYCRTIGAEYMHINETSQKRWIQERLEAEKATPSFSKDEKRQILERLIAAGALEEYLHMKYVGQKRFSLEGGESLIPLLDDLIQVAGANGVKEVVIGMAHRGRINVLVNIMGKLPADLFEEFEGRNSSALGSGDVKYHLGFSSDISTP